MTRVRSFRFLLVGGICAALNTIIMTVLSERGFGILLASVLTFLPVLFVGYALHAAFTFRMRASKQSLVRYSVTMLANFPLWITFITIFADLANLLMQIAAPLTIASIFAWNF